jgi:ADP-L-glycero-D-manno-heptose 6-epimerase
MNSFPAKTVNIDASMILVTGGAGFIGSNIVARLNETGHSDVVVCDSFGTTDKWRNIAKRRIGDVVPPRDLMGWLATRKLEAVIHLGAISDTTASDADLVLEVNFRLSLRLLDWCTATRTRFIYASSAATYGDEEDFDDGWALELLGRLKPMNLYGFSKHLFDLALVDRFSKGMTLPPQWVGLKFFNVFGPNEYHKGEMMSLVAKRFDEAKAGRPVRLFKSYRSDIADGDQKRDFIYVDDAVAVTCWLLEMPSVSGIFNVGTGYARSFRDLIKALFTALGRAPQIEYVDMPPSIRNQYQYFTQARTENLRRAGYNADFTPLERAVDLYVNSFLSQTDRYR